MFTGIVSDIGTIERVQSEGDTRVRIATSYDPDTIDLGASIACSGVCLTVIDKGTADTHWFDVQVSGETIARTARDQWTPGRRLNLERAMKLGDELGGHIVTGHVDGIAEILARETVTGEDNPWGASERFTLRAPAVLAGFIAEKGSICLDGTSLTVNAVSGADFSVLLIPHSLSVTTWEERRAGDRINLEVDLLARYAARLAETRGLLQG